MAIYGESGGRLFDTIPKIHDADGHARNLAHFADVVNGDAEPDFIPQQGVNMIKILNAIYKSAETGREVLL